MTAWAWTAVIAWMVTIGIATGVLGALRRWPPEFTVGVASALSFAAFLLIAHLVGAT